MTDIERLTVNGLLKVGSLALPLSILVEGRNQSLLVISPSTAGVELDESVADEVGISALEAEATGLPPVKVCETLNRLCSGFLVTASDQCTISAITALYKFADAAAAFNLVPNDLMKAG